jgi:hypothetical protein
VAAAWSSAELDEPVRRLPEMATTRIGRLYLRLRTHSVPIPTVKGGDGSETLERHFARVPHCTNITRLPKATLVSALNSHSPGIGGVSPPGCWSIDMLGLEGGTDAWCHDVRAALGREGEKRLGGLVPFVEGEVEGAPMNGNSVPPPSISKAVSAFWGPRWIESHAGWNPAPMSNGKRPGPRSVGL